MVRVSEDDGTVPVLHLPPVESAVKPAGGPVALAPPAPRAAPAARARPVAPAKPTAPARSTEEPTAELPAATEPAGEARPSRRRWALIAGAAAVAVLATAASAYLVFGTGKAKVGRAKNPAPGGAAPVPARGAAPTPPAPSAPKGVAARPGPSPREVVAAALAADPDKFRYVRLTDAVLRGRVLTLRGAVRSPALKPEVEWVAKHAVRQSGLGADVQVENELREPLELVHEAVARKFGKEVTVTAVRLDDGRLTLEGSLTRWAHLLPARELAVRTLEEAGLGPITTWDNHLKKPMN
jgi:hypothetical protein